MATSLDQRSADPDMQERAAYGLQVHLNQYAAVRGDLVSVRGFTEEREAFCKTSTG